MKRTTLLAAAIAALMSGIGGTASADTAIIVRTAPPVARVETMPAPRMGHVWVEGHYQWRHGQYVWTPGHWQVAKRNMHWVQAHWQQRRSGEWVYVAGHWARGGNGDKDRDGIANKYDHDKDGDGVPNRYDRAPGNPNRS